MGSVQLPFELGSIPRIGRDAQSIDLIFGHRPPLLRDPAEAEEPMFLTWTPRVDVAEEYVISVELPGVKKDEVKGSVEDRVLTISGERKSEKEEKEKVS